MALREILDDTMTSWARERPDLELEAMGTVLRLGQLMTVSLRALDDVLAPHRITLGEFDVLAALRRGGPDTVLTPTVLARVGMVSPGGMTSRLNRLEAAELIRRRPDPDDRRGSLVTLTPAGRRLADAVITDLAAADQALLAVLSPTEHQRLDRTLDKLIARVEDLVDPDR